jgi:exocyst complex protein 7
MFLLNNVAYIRFRVLLEPRNPSLPELLSRPTQDVVQSNFRTAKAAYFDASFTPMMQALSDDPKGNKAATKEKFTRFFDLLDEVAERHRLARMLDDDEDGRDTLAEEVVKLIVPSLQRFTQKNREKEFSKSSSLCLNVIPG